MATAGSKGGRKGMEKQVERNRAKAASRKGGSSLGYQRSQPRPDMVFQHLWSLRAVVTLLSFLGQGTCMKSAQRAAVITVSTCRYEMASMTKVRRCPLPFPLAQICAGPSLQSHDKPVFLSKGYKHLFQPVINQVVDYYQPTCIVLQVRN